MQSAGRPLTSEKFDLYEEVDDCIRVEIYNKKVEVLYWNTASRLGLLRVPSVVPVVYTEF